ncbi:MAG: hypothetical protein KAI53_04865 [Candidatus Aenigmarchaeota archaeon]|nr:hypothetical protein [Candidatus Aenigmarchaeota archaeon]
MVSKKEKKDLKKAAKKNAKKLISNVNLDAKTIAIILLVLVIAVISIPGKTNNVSNEENNEISKGVPDIVTVPKQEPTPTKSPEVPKEPTPSFKFNGLKWSGTCGVSETSSVSFLYESDFDGKLNWNGSDFTISKSATERPLLSNPEEGTYNFYITDSTSAKIYESVVVFSKAKARVSGDIVLDSPILYEYPSGLKDYGVDINIIIQNAGTMSGCVYVSGNVDTKNIGTKCSYFSAPGTTEEYICRAEVTLAQGTYDYRIFLSGLETAFVRTGSVSVPV